MYLNIAKDAAKKSALLSKDSSASASLKRAQLKDLVRSMNLALQHSGQQLNAEIEQEMRQVSAAVGVDMKKWLSKAGMPKLKVMFASVPDDVVKRVATGSIYKEKWTLSGAIWGDIKAKQDDINFIVAEGIAANKSTYDIAKDLEKYVDPKAKKDWQWSKVYPRTGKIIDYNAQRLARTMLTHAYQQAVEQHIKYNPFVSGVVWHTAHSGRVCELCKEREGKFYRKGEAPLDHPNGMCFLEAQTQPLDDVADQLADWVNGADRPDIDRYYQFLKE